MFILCEAAKRVMKASVKDMVAEAGGKPLLNSKSADGTPTSVVHRHTAKQPSGATVQASGKGSHELLMENRLCAC